MRERTTRLALLSQQYRVRSLRLLSLVKHLNAPIDQSHARVIAYVTIEIWNTWASFSRALFISSALRAFTARGHRVAITVSGISTPTDAVALALLKIRGYKKPTFARYQEPAWHDKDNLITLFAELGASNALAVNTALSFPTSAFTSLHAARNFFAHRNADTASSCSTIGGTLSSRLLHPADALAYRPTGKPNNLLSEWITDLLAVSDMMVQ